MYIASVILPNDRFFMSVPTIGTPTVAITGKRKRDTKNRPISTINCRECSTKIDNVCTKFRCGKHIEFFGVEILDYLSLREMRHPVLGLCCDFSKDVSLVYKVVRVCGAKGGRTSPVACPSYAVIYEPGHKTYPIHEGTKLLAFEDYKSARSFLYDWRDRRGGIYEIWLAHGGNSQPKHRIPSLANHRSWSKYWQNPELYTKIEMGAPIGTITCDWISLKKLIRIVFP